MTAKAPERLETTRLRLRRPVRDDADRAFERYASDPEVTRYLAWPRHATRLDTLAFVDFSDREWATWPAGPYMIERRDDGVLLGSTGLTFEAPGVASTGYVLAQDAWGRGYASEALAAMVEVAASVGLPELSAVCHPAHVRSARVLGKCGFVVRAGLTHLVAFPNLATPPVRCPVYVRVLVPV